MCLLTKQILPCRARKDIVVYKVLEDMSFFDSHLQIVRCFKTPYQRTKVRLNDYLIAEGETKTPNFHHSRYFNELIGYRRKIEGGYIHCYTNFTRAKTVRFYLDDGVVVECIIPKGTLYFKSYDGSEICAEKVYVKRVVASVL